MERKYLKASNHVMAWLVQRSMVSFRIDPCACNRHTGFCAPIRIDSFDDSYNMRSYIVCYQIDMCSLLELSYNHPDPFPVQAELYNDRLY
jgi:hypothetical protein